MEGSVGLLGLLPFGVVITSAVIVWVLFALGKVSGEMTQYVVTRLVFITLGVLAVIIFVRLVCMNIQPVELFAVSDPIAALWSDIISAEKDACAYMTRADGFIQNNVGKAGQDNPALITQAQQSSRAAAGSPLTDCSGGVPVDQSLDEAENHIARLETTLNGFTAPVFQQAYKAANTCESFVDDTARLTDLQQRMAAIQQVLTLQKSKYLDPIDAKQKAMQSGQLSDCDKTRGANAGASIAGGAVPY